MSRRHGKSSLSIVFADQAVKLARTLWRRRNHFIEMGISRRQETAPWLVYRDAISSEPTVMHAWRKNTIGLGYLCSQPCCRRYPYVGDALAVIGTGIVAASLFLAARGRSYCRNSGPIAAVRPAQALPNPAARRRSIACIDAILNARDHVTLCGNKDYDRSGQARRQPCIRGLRITVWDVLGWLGAGMTEEEILYEHPDLEKADFPAVYRYAAEVGRKANPG